jgi:hypothetical protein
VRGPPLVETFASVPLLSVQYTFWESTVMLTGPGRPDASVSQVPVWHWPTPPAGTGTHWPEPGAPQAVCSGPMDAQVQSTEVPSGPGKNAQHEPSLEESWNRHDVAARQRAHQGASRSTARSISALNNPANLAALKPFGSGGRRRSRAIAPAGGVYDRAMTARQPKKKDRAGVDRAGRTPVHYAALNGDSAEVARLLAGGADPSAADDQGWTPLHFAAQGRHATVARALLVAGANVDARDSHGNTPLSNAVFNCDGVRGDLIALLRSHGADPHAENKHGVSPASLARTIANCDVAQFFKDLP